MIKTNGNYAKTVTAAHRGNMLAQQALAVIEDVRHCLVKSCRENHIAMPNDYLFDGFSEQVADSLTAASPWLKGCLDKYGTDIRQLH